MQHYSIDFVGICREIKRVVCHQELYMCLCSNPPLTSVKVTHTLITVASEWTFQQLYIDTHTLITVASEWKFQVIYRYPHIDNSSKRMDISSYI